MDKEILGYIVLLIGSYCVQIFMVCIFLSTDIDNVKYYNHHKRKLWFKTKKEFYKWLIPFYWIWSIIHSSYYFFKYKISDHFESINK